MQRIIFFQFIKIKLCAGTISFIYFKRSKLGVSNIGIKSTGNSLVLKPGSKNKGEVAYRLTINTQVINRADVFRCSKTFAGRQQDNR